MMCEFEEDLTALLDQELPAGRAEQLRAHLGGCGTCPQTLALLQGALARLSTLPELQPSPVHRSAVLTRIASLPSPRTLSDWLRPTVWLPALGAAAVVVVAVWLPGQAERWPQPGLLAEADRLELAANLEVLEDLEVLGLESVEDLEVVMRLGELEATP